MLDEYEINNETLAILPYKGEFSEVIEQHHNYVIKQSPKQIIEDSCKYYGSSYEGRVLGTKKLTGINYKVPVIIEESNPTIFFPTESPRTDTCSWINLKKIEDYESTHKGSVIIFQDGKRIVLNISKFSLENQIFRSARLVQRLNDRKLSKK